MRRDLDSNTQHIREVAESVLREKTRIAYLATTLIASSRQVYVQFSNPLFTRGSTGKADVAAGVDLAALEVGTPVTVLIRRGQIQVVGIPLQSTIDAVSAALNAVERVYASKSASQTISNNTTTAITFDTNDTITEDSFHSTTSDTSRFVAPWPGCYHVSCSIRYNAVSAAGRMQLLLRNSAGVSYPGGQRVDVVTTGTAANLNASFDIDLLADDWVDWATFQVTGASQDITLARATMRYIGT